MVGRKLPFPASDRAIHTRPSLHITLADNSFPWRHFLLPPRTADYWKHVKVRRMAIVLQNLDRLQESLGMLQEWLQCLRSTKKIPEGSVLNFVPSHMTSIKAWSLAGSSVVIVAKFSFLAVTHTLIRSLLESERDLQSSSFWRRLEEQKVAEDESKIQGKWIFRT